MSEDLVARLRAEYEPWLGPDGTITSGQRVVTSGLLLKLAADTIARLQRERDEAVKAAWRGAIELLESGSVGVSITGVISREMFRARLRALEGK